VHLIPKFGGLEPDTFFAMIFVDNESGLAAPSLGVRREAIMKRIVLFVILSFAFLADSVDAQQFGSKYDWQSGNRYNWNQDSSGSTHLRGNNSNTGSQWNTTIQPNGSMRGFDSNGNSWNYNAQSGTYMNYGTGKMCVGKGVGRVCN
jgi:hypothetical protein